MSSERPAVPVRQDFRHFHTMQTRWLDNDVYGHVNNVNYYSYFDTAVNRYLLEHAGLDFVSGTAVFVVAETSCRYHSSFTYPEDIVVGLAITRLGNASATYALALFGKDDDVARADGHYVHVCVARDSMRPAAMPDSFRNALAKLVR